ncbi:MAG: helix-turn-helix domain-containing protein [Coriobacteriia bacterium]|nr:helix-turn-helix domain-containing protein [Coriobacteriia bacterium]
MIAARQTAGITQAELGRRLGVAQPQVARWEAAAYRNVALERVSAVAEALGFDIAAPDLPLAAEAPGTYETTLPGADAEALRALARTRTSPAALAAFARTHGIERLELFGSVLRPDFTPESDVDVLVTYAPDRVPSLFRLVDHETELAGLLRRRVDLVSRRGIERSENTIRREAILTTARTIYARP